MTVVFTAATPFCIVAASDSAVSIDDAFGRSYEKGLKSHSLPGVGVVTTWGARDGNAIGRMMAKWKEEAAITDVQELADCVIEYLREDYRPADRAAGSVGFHISGFNRRKEPKIYHAFYNAPESAGGGGYDLQEHSPGPGLFALYNGRDDIVDPVVKLLLKEIEAGHSPFKLQSAVDLVAFAHLVLRFAREVTFDVAPPFHAHVISDDGPILHAVLPEWEPVTTLGALADFVVESGRIRYVHKLT